MRPDEFFAGREESRRLFERVREAVAPLVLTIGLRRKDESPRWKEIVEPRPGRYTHYLELRSESDVDDEVRGWLREAWGQAA